MEFEETVLFIASLERIADPARPCAKHDRYKYLDLKSKEIEIYSATFAYSVMGVFYKVSPATSHAIYKIGDVITEVDGKSCRKFEDYRAKAGRVYTIYRRRANGSFQKLVSEMPEGQPRVALVNLKE